MIRRIWLWLWLHWPCVHDWQHIPGGFAWCRRCGEHR